MQAGCPLVMADLPALAEIVTDGETGRLYPPDDVESLANTIRELLEDETLRTNLGNSAAEWITMERTWGSVVSNIPSLYNKLV